MAARRFWLMKTEPESFSIEDLEKRGREPWNGVRNYQSRNSMRDDMKVGDLVLLYHSNAEPTGVAGIARVACEAYPDPTCWDPESQYFDPKSSPENPRWFMVDVEFVERFPEVLSLAEMKALPELEGMLATKRGMRLSIQPVEKEHFDFIRKLGKKRAR